MAEFFCNKCGYVGPDQLHKGCNYAGSPIDEPSIDAKLDAKLDRILVAIEQLTERIGRLLTLLGQSPS